MPAEQPFKFTDKRRWSGYSGTSNFSEPVRERYSQQRRFVTGFDKDTPKLLGFLPRTTLLQMGRSLYQDNASVRNAVNEMAMLSGAGIQQQFDGTDQGWGTVAEEWLYGHDRICDMRGGMFNMHSLRELIVVSWLRDGDCGILLTENADGYPLFQMIPGHRIGSRGSSDVESGPYAGMRITDGVIINDYGRPVAYRILGDDASLDRDIPAESFILAYVPEYADQLRGVSPLAVSIIDFQDVGESRRLELISQKVFAGMSLIVHNETGGPETTANLTTRYGSGGTNSDGSLSTDGTPVSTDEIIPGEMRYFRAGSNSKIEALTADRPTMNQQAFKETIVRQALAGIGWSVDFSLDPTKAGGAQMRVVVEKINQKLANIRSRLLFPILRRLDGYRIAKAQKLGLVPPSEEWFHWSYIPPAEITADKKYDSDVAIQEYKAGIRTLADVCGRRSIWWRDLLAAKKIETGELLQAAKELAEQYDIAMPDALVLLRDTASYSTQTNSAGAVADSTADAAEETANEPATAD